MNTQGKNTKTLGKRRALGEMFNLHAMREGPSLYTNTLDHLPAEKRAELERIVEIIRREVEVEMLILFGSYATGKWVEDQYVEDGTTYEYRSDMDILAVTKSAKAYNYAPLMRASDIIRKDPSLGIASIIHHSINFLNERIIHQYYFFLDVFKEGIILYNSGRCKIARPQPLKPEMRLKKAKEEFEYWFEKGDDSLAGFNFYIGVKKYSMAAFLLHQSTESYYSAFLLVFTDYRPKTHDLADLGSSISKILGSSISKINQAMASVFPCNTQEEKALFELLRSAYVDARYKKDYTITPEELAYLSERVLLLRALTEECCREEIARLEQAVQA